MNDEQILTILRATVEQSANNLGPDGLVTKKYREGVEPVARALLEKMLKEGN